MYTNTSYKTKKRIKLEIEDERIVSALEYLVPRSDDERRRHCHKHMDGWRLCSDDVIVRVHIAGGLLCVECAPLHVDDRFLEQMQICMTSVQVRRVVEDQTEASDNERQLRRVFAAAWHDDEAFRYQHSVLACMLWMTPLIAENKQFMLVMGDSDVAKDSQLYNPLRHLAPGIVAPAAADFLYGVDKSKLAAQRARQNYNVAEVHPDINISRIDMDIQRTMYGNSSETAVRGAYSSKLEATGTFPVMMLMANYDSYPRRGLPAAVLPKVLHMLSHRYDDTGEPVERIMRRFISDDGQKTVPSDEDLPFVPKAYSDMARAGRSWVHAAAFGCHGLRELKASVAGWNALHPTRDWNPMAGMPNALRPQLKNYDRKRKRDAPALDVVAPEIAAAQVVLQPTTDVHETPDEALRALVSEVAKLYVPNVPGKWITPMVRAEPRTHPNFDTPCYRSPVTDDRCHRKWLPACEISATPRRCGVGLVDQARCRASPPS